MIKKFKNGPEKARSLIYDTAFQCTLNSDEQQMNVLGMQGLGICAIGALMEEPHITYGGAVTVMIGFTAATVKHKSSQRALISANTAE